MYVAPVMEIALITPAVAPLTGDSELANICGALPKSLRGLNLGITVIAPMLGSLDPERVSLARRLSTIEVDVDGTPQVCSLYDGRTPGGATLTLLANDDYFGSVASFSDPEDSRRHQAGRAALFAEAVATLLRESTTDFDIVHAHGWPGAAVLDHLRNATPGPHLPAVLSLHDADDLGTFSSDDAKPLGLDDVNGDVVLLERGVRAADRVIVNSETYAASLISEERGHPLRPALEEAGVGFLGISRGVDSANWNPATDSHIPSRFDPVDLTGKARSKASLQDEFGLPIRAKVPLIGLVVRNDDDSLKEIDELIPELARNDVQLAACVDGAGEFFAALEALSERWPDRIQVSRWEPGLDHLIIGGSDLLIIPPGEGETGSQHLRAHRYGTLPVALRTGSIVDSVIDSDGELRTGNGFTAAVADGLLSPLQRAVAAYQNHGAFDALRRRAMHVDHSWERSARHYEHVYRGLLQSDEADPEA